MLMKQENWSSSREVKDVFVLATICSGKDRKIARQDPLLIETDKWTRNSYLRELDKKNANDN